MILGPLYLLAVGLPSIVWSQLPAFDRYRRRQGVSYYAPVFERGANRLGVLVTGEPAMGE